MRARATTVVDIFRDADDTDADQYGDETETGTDPLTSGVPASIIEQTRRAPDTTSGDLVPVSALVGRVGGDVDVRKGDRLRDRDGAFYAVLSVRQPQSPIGQLDRVLELRRTP